MDAGRAVKERADWFADHHGYKGMVAVYVIRRRSKQGQSKYLGRAPEDPAGPQVWQRSSLLHPALYSMAWESCVTQPSSQLPVLWKGEPTHLRTGKNFSLLRCINTEANNQTSKQDPACLTFNPGWKHQCPASSTGTEPHVSEI